VSGLGHFLEAEGIATTAISLIREHAEQTRPPRALNVPFDFGHPFGAPNDAALQLDVLRGALALFERSDGPVLEDWLGEPGTAATHPDGSSSPWACPIPLQVEATPGGDDVERLRAAAEAELALLLPWYEHAVAERGRTTVGACGLPVSELLPFVAGFLSETPPESPRADLPTAIALKTACEDLKQLYLEAATAQPVVAGTARPTHAELNDWFWRDTRVAALLREVGTRAKAIDLPMMGMVSTFLLLPFMRSNPAP
jgi:hypothetical protein